MTDTAAPYDTMYPAMEPEFLELLERNGEILAQLELLESLASARRELDSQTTWALDLWRHRLHAALVDSAALAINPSNVNENAAAKDRVAAMRALLNATVDDTDANQSAAARTTVKKFMLRLSWHEGWRLTRRAQVNGPALSFFQFEAYRAKEAIAYAGQAGLLGKLASISGQPQAELTRAGQALPTYGTPSAERFPNGNLIGDLLRRNDLFGCYLARVTLKQIPETIPADNEAQAQYWFSHWKRVGGDEAALKAAFKTAADEVDRL